MIRPAVLLVCVVSLGSRLLFGQIPDEERIPIRDPERLQALGFPRDATNVSVWSKAQLGLGARQAANHVFFQFVEALAKSGITAGCGNGNFCPDQPLTRGQMAVFLAKALGLEWP